MDLTGDSSADEAALAEAASWRIRLRELGVDTTAGFEAWLSKNPANRAAWARAQELWAQIDLWAQTPKLQAEVEAVLARGPAKTARRSIWRPMAAAAALVALIGGGVGASWFSTRPTVYETEVGERRTISLPDHSTVLLDSASRLEVRYTPLERDLNLTAGQAKFDVAHDASRPFSVEAGDRTVVATGTSFNVELLGEQVLVTLLEGRVSVFSDGGRRSPLLPSREPSAPVQLNPGERFASLAEDAPRDVVTRGEIQRVSAQRATAWQSGSLIVENEQLSAVAERMSRYTERPVVVADQRAREMRISGVFQTGDVTAFVEAITGYLPVDATVGTSNEIVLRSRG